MFGFTFNIDCGYLEGVCRGFKGAMLTKSDYLNLMQCETLDDLKMHLHSTDYGHFLADEMPPLTPGIIAQRLREALVLEFRYMRNQAVEPLATFLDYITYGYMIDNVILLMTGALRQRSVDELLPKCHPLGSFQEMGALHVATTMHELYYAILIDSPVAPFLADCLSVEDLDDVDMEVLRNRLQRAHLEAFFQYCQHLGATTADVMGDLLAFEADRRAIILTINALDTVLPKQTCTNLYPRCGRLQPDGLLALATANDYGQVQAAASSCCIEYRELFEGDEQMSHGQSLEDRFAAHEVKLHVRSFMRQFHFGVFYSYLRLREQEHRNIVWIAECIAQGRRKNMEQYIAIF
ncbi:V-type proton ATPase subunit d-like [Anopheles bellator]|uniref:V-type proton ATPase subunit d-like n=1 Tax=Anopheles bellator TaxID=139047 RepID=UPI002648051A|nr:V-type proton ATPase subunit d-like [Anopheles bellator]